jgi:penicillin amidase
MRKWFWPLLTAVLLAALFYPWPGLPPLGSFLLYPTSPLQIDYAIKGSSSLPGTHTDLEIHYDERGVPHLFAQSDTSLAFGMGFTHARDRLFQLEMLRRTVRGRLAEVAGAKALESDRWWLKFEFEKLAQSELERISQEEPQLAAMFKAYADGFNHYLEQLSPGEKPLEFHLLGFAPSPMKPYAPLMLIRYMDKVLDYSENDLKFSALRNYLPDSLIEYYYPWQSPYARFPIYPEISKDSNAVTKGILTDYVSRGDFPKAEVKRERNNELGSNNWAVAGSRSATGNAFLCNDTHLALALPGTWYEVHQVVKGKATHGFSIPGSPFIISGFSDKVAWGMTNATWDLTDFFALNTNAENQYELDGQWVDLDQREVIIPVKDAPADTFHYYQTYFGPATTMDGELLATRWVASESTGNEMLAFYQLRQASNLEEAYQALLNFSHPPQNFVLADANGQIGMVTSGLAPIAPVPQRGIIAAKQSQQRLDFYHLGRKLKVLRPEKGWNHSANQTQVSDSLGPYLNSIFAPTARGRIISQHLSENPSVSRNDLKALHASVEDGEWPLLKDFVVNTAPASFKKTLADWDGKCTEKSVAATLYNHFKWLYCDSLSHLLIGHFDFQPPAEHLFYLSATQDSLPTKEAYLKPGELAKAVWQSSKRQLAKTLGAEMEAWQYGRYHRIHFKHITGLEALSYTAFPAQGSPRTVNVSSGLPGTHGPAMRSLVELSDGPPKAETVLAGGQSGQPGHPHYTDQITNWYEVKYYPVKWVLDAEEGHWQYSIHFR